jgi:long-subunit acyl-CoA synthetase (AMP-forming)
VFKLTQGEYVAPSHLELIYQSSPFIDQIYIHANSIKPYLVAVAVPNEAVLQQAKKANGISGSDDLESVCQNEELLRHVLRNLCEIAIKAEVKPCGFWFLPLSYDLTKFCKDLFWSHIASVLKTTS